MVSRPTRITLLFLLYLKFPKILKVICLDCKCPNYVSVSSCDFLHDEVQVSMPTFDAHPPPPKPVLETPPAVFADASVGCAVFQGVWQLTWSEAVRRSAGEAILTDGTVPSACRLCPRFL